VTVGGSYEQLGDLQMQLGDTASAQRYYEKSLAVREELVKLDPSNTAFRSGVSAPTPEPG